jgi:hypothetical protein
VVDSPAASAVATASADAVTADVVTADAVTVDVATADAVDAAGAGKCSFSSSRNLAVFTCKPPVLTVAIPLHSQQGRGGEVGASHQARPPRAAGTNY